MCVRGHTHSSRPAASEVAGRATKRKCLLPLSVYSRCTARLVATAPSSIREALHIRSHRLLRPYVLPAATVRERWTTKVIHLKHLADMTFLSE